MVMAPIRLRLWLKNYLVGYVLEQGDFCAIERRCQLLILNELSGINQWAWSIGGIKLTGAERSTYLEKNHKFENKSRMDWSQFKPGPLYWETED
jgi:hypothetical protein